MQTVTRHSFNLQIQDEEDSLKTPEGELKEEKQDSPSVKPEEESEKPTEPVVQPDVEVKTRHSLPDGMNHFPFHLTITVLRTVGSLLMMTVGVLLFIAARWISSEAAAVEFLKHDVGPMETADRLILTAGIPSVIVSLYLAWSTLVYGHLQFDEKPRVPETWTNLRVEAFKAIAEEE